MLGLPCDLVLHQRCPSSLQDLGRCPHVLGRSGTQMLKKLEEFVIGALGRVLVHKHKFKCFGAALLPIGRHAGPLCDLASCQCSVGISLIYYPSSSSILWKCKHLSVELACTPTAAVHALHSSLASLLHPLHHYWSCGGHHCAGFTL